MDDLNMNAEISSEVSAPSIETPVIESQLPTSDAPTTEKDLDNLWNQAKNPTVTPTEPEAKEVPKTPEAETVVTEDETDDPLKEFETDRIPNDDELNSKIIRHIPKAERESVQKAFADARSLREFENKLGGQNAIPVLEQVSQVLFTPEVNQATTAQFLETVITANPNLLESMGEIFFTGAWTMAEPKWQGLIDNQLQQQFGEGMTRDRLTEMANWMKAGLFDPDQLREDYSDLGFTNPRIAELEEQVRQLTQKTESEPRKQVEQLQAEQERKANLQKVSDDYLYEQVSEVINPIIEKLAWVKNENDPPEWAESKEIMSEMREAWIKTKVESSSYYKNIKFLLESGQAADAQGNPSQIYKMQIERIQGITKAAVISAGRKLQPTFTNALKSSRNAQIVNNPIEQPRSVPNTQVAPQVPQNGNYIPSEDDLTNTWKRLGQVSVADNTAQRRMMNGRG